MEQSRKPAVAAEAHLGLVHLCANRFRERGIEYEELYSAGCLGLVKAANAFDAERGVCFSTYAVPVILGEIRRLFREGGSVHVGRRLQELGMRASRTAEQLRQQNGAEPTVRQIADALGISESETAEALCAAQPVASLTSRRRKTGYRSIWHWSRCCRCWMPVTAGCCICVIMRI